MTQYDIREDYDDELFIVIKTFVYDFFYISEVISLNPFEQSAYTY